MHPLLARYLDPARAMDVLARRARGEQVADEDRHLAAAADAFSDERDLLLSSGPDLDADVQRVLLFLATHAAVRALAEDEALGPQVARAREGLGRHGAKPEHATALIAEVVAEEAFATEEAPDAFDAAWVAESLGLLPVLAALEEEAVNGLIAEHARTGKEATALLRERAARALLEEAWGDGASPVNVEHVEEALDELYGEVGEDDFTAAAAAVRGFVDLLEARGLAGPLRAARLRRAVDRAAHAGAADPDEDAGTDD